jgi:arylsulfatase A-like enzyme
MCVADPSRPNVLFIAVDDMRDWTASLGGYRGEVHTPHLEQLASQGVEFTNAHTASPVCCPSRAAIMTGLLPSTSGIYNNGPWWRPHMPECVTVPMHFKAAGYAVAGAGKIFHHTAGNNPPDQWDEYQRLVFRNDPHEWNNLAGDDEYRPVIAEHARWLPAAWAENAPSKGAYQFDSQTYRWIHKKTGTTTYGDRR